MQISLRLLASACALVFPASVVAQDAGPPIACNAPYEVAIGDTLSKIGLRAFGEVSFDTIYEANRDVIGPNPNLIFVGQVLQIPCADGGAVETASQVEDVEQADDGAVVLTFNKSSGPRFIINSGIIDLYLAEITEATEGRVQFIDPPEMNRDGAAQLDLVTSGAVDGAYVFNGYLSESHPLLQLPMLPLMGGSAEQTAVSLWRLHETYLSETDYFADAHLLGFVAAPAAHIWRRGANPVFAGEGVLEKNDYAIPYFAGLDTRGPATIQEEHAAWLTEYLQQETTEPTFFLAHGAARAIGIWNGVEGDPIVTEVDYGVYTPTFSVVLSNEAWDRIAEQDRTLIDELSGAALATKSASWDAFDSGFRRDMLEGGLRTFKADGAFLDELQISSDAGARLWADAANAAGIAGEEAIEFYRDSLDSLQDRLIFR